MWTSNLELHDQTFEKLKEIYQINQTNFQVS